MLASFIMRRNFNKLTVTMHVDCERKEASVAVSYDRRLIRASEIIPFWEVQTPEKANAYFSRPMGERGSFVESLEWQCSSGILTAA